MNSHSNARRFKSLKHFVQDGLWSSSCEGIAESNFSAFAVFLSATAAQVGWLTSIQQLSSCGMQLWTEKLIGLFKSRKRLVLFCVMIQITALILLVAGTIADWGIGSFCALSIAYTAFGSLSSPAWNSWISDLLPARRRGTCFALRNQRTHPASFIALVAGGCILDAFTHGFGGRIAFCAVFAAGLFAKLSALRHLSWQQEHPYTPSVRGHVGPFGLIREVARDGELRRIVSFFGMMGFAVNLSNAFQVPYLLKTMGYSYTQYTFLFGVMAIARFLSAPFVGRFVDHYGSRRLLSISSAAMPLIPFGWCMTHSYFALIGVFFFSGMVWAAFDLCTFTYLAETVVAAKRSRAFAARQITWNLVSFLGGITGVALIEKFGNNALSVFWASAFCRAAAAIFVLRLPRALSTSVQEAEVPAEAA